MARLARVVIPGIPHHITDIIGGHHTAPMSIGGVAPLWRS